MGTQIFGVVGGAEIPVIWAFADMFWVQLTFVVMVPGPVGASVWLVGIQVARQWRLLSILTQAMTLALALYLFQNDSGLRGNNGLSGLQNIPGLDATPQALISIWFFMGSAAALGLIYLVAHAVVSSKLGNIIRGIRDNEARVRFLGYNVKATSCSCLSSQRLSRLLLVRFTILRLGSSILLNWPR